MEMPIKPEVITEQQ